jgi:hypothetical protein
MGRSRRGRMEKGILPENITEATHFARLWMRKFALLWIMDTDQF